MLTHLIRAIGICIIAMTWTASAEAELLSVPFPVGVVGPIGTNSNKIDGVVNFATLGVVNSHFMQASDSSQFGGTQGNDYAGTLRLVLSNGNFIDVPGAVNWRITTNGKIEYFGFIPDPANPVRTISYSGGTYRLDATRNYAVRKLASTLAYPDGTFVNGNAAQGQLIPELNIYLDEIRKNAPVITGPSGGAGSSSSSISVPENQTAATKFAASVPATWEIVSGADAAFFTIDRTTGILVFKTAPDFEKPLDANKDNIYEVVISATGTNKSYNMQASSVRVTDVDETPKPDITTSKTVKPVSLPTVPFVCASDPVAAGADVMTPGVCVEYRIDLVSRANGSAPVQMLAISDPIPNFMRFAAILSHSGFDSVTFDGVAISARRSSFPAGTSAFFTVRALID